MEVECSCATTQSVPPVTELETPALSELLMNQFKEFEELQQVERPSVPENAASCKYPREELDRIERCLMAPILYMQANPDLKHPSEYPKIQIANFADENFLDAHGYMTRVDDDFGDYELEYGHGTRVWIRWDSIESENATLSDIVTAFELKTRYSEMYDKVRANQQETNRKLFEKRADQFVKRMQTIKPVISKSKKKGFVEYRYKDVFSSDASCVANNLCALGAYLREHEKLSNVTDVDVDSSDDDTAVIEFKVLPSIPKP